jgi:hypothetical protein
MIPYKFKQILAIDFIALWFQIKVDIKAARIEATKAYRVSTLGSRRRANDNNWTANALRKGKAEGLVKMPL